MVVHPYLGLPIDEAQIDAVAAIKAVTSLGSSPLQEYIDKVCSSTCPLLPIIERGRIS